MFNYTKLYIEKNAYHSYKIAKSNPFPLAHLELCPWFKKYAVTYPAKQNVKAIFMRGRIFNPISSAGKWIEKPSYNMVGSRHNIFSPTDDSEKVLDSVSFSGHQIKRFVSTEY